MSSNKKRTLCKSWATSNKTGSLLKFTNKVFVLNKYLFKVERKQCLPFERSQQSIDAVAGNDPCAHRKAILHKEYPTQLLKQEHNDDIEYVYDSDLFDQHPHEPGKTE